MGVCVVTGGASGIGAAVIDLLLEEKRTVVSLDVTPQSRDDVALSVQCDVSEEAEVRVAIEQAEQLGQIEGLVNCAAVQIPGATAATSLKDWQRTLSVNLTGAFLTMREVIPAMRRSRSGAIVNVSSVAGFLPQRDTAAYATSKAALINLTRAAAVDHGRDGVRVNCVCPGTIRTPLVERNARVSDPENPTRLLEAWSAGHPLGRLGQPREVAAVIKFLLGPESSFVTGAIWNVDGGLAAANPLP
jgi:NAD(P)-dependent dehydrogenase (short-subunit alcohol dehydrogenase family)